MKVLVTDASYPSTLAITRYLGKRGIDVCLVGENRWAYSFFSKFCKQAFVGPPPTAEQEYAQFVLDVITKNSFDILIPVGYRANKVIVKEKSVMDKYVKIETFDYEKFSFASNKSYTNSLAEELSIPYPKTLYPRTLNEVRTIAPTLRYPTVVKPLLERGGGGSIYPQNMQELIAGFLHQCETFGFKEGSLPMIQEYINGDPYTYAFGALYQEGKCKRFYMHKELRSTPVTGGSGSRLETIYDTKLKEYATRLLDSLVWHGIALVEFKKNANGDYCLMEINAKFWNSTEVALKAGCNFPYYLCQMAKGSKLKYSEQYDRNLSFHFISRELEYMRSRPRAIMAIIVDTLNPKVKSDVWLSDFKPNAVEFFMIVTGLIRKRKFYERLKFLHLTLKRALIH